MSDQQNLCPTQYEMEVACPVTYMQMPSTHSEAQAGTVVHSLIVYQGKQLENEDPIMQLDGILLIMTYVLFNASSKQFVLAKEVDVQRPTVLCGFRRYYFCV